ncbi:LOW QUALITY PROTEIN: Protein CBG09084 [Caenorhabditis briggsae]|uniref:Protein CBG09084 n=1 Tax=Caenorhabditis briggsae TaxID=6238 RepID=A8X7U4_CAEBR|nr:LOW QUALITY PROTEIN: Protein CBG09084 [Caenorhabditis briggsae]CAP28705.1 Protein CBG09084 [Caenorhabditis briggsae]
MRRDGGSQNPEYPYRSIDQMRNRETDRTTLSRFVLEGICTGLTTSRTQIHQLCSLLLFNSNTTSESDNSIEMLLQNSFISLEDDLFSPTQLGRAAIASSLPPEASLAIFEDLNSASRAIAVDTELHMLYLVTPINVTVWQECDWHHLFSLFSKLPSDHRRVAKMVGASEKFILEQLQGKRNQKALQVHIRFFSALALFDLINEMSIYQVNHLFGTIHLENHESRSPTSTVFHVAAFKLFNRKAPLTQM